MLAHLKIVIVWLCDVTFGDYFFTAGVTFFLSREILEILECQDPLENQERLETQDAKYVLMLPVNITVFEAVLNISIRDHYPQYSLKQFLFQVGQSHVVLNLKHFSNQR